jgi:membrane protease YdiL (CAAX protease family)
MTGSRRWTATIVVSLVAGLTVLPSSLAGQGTTAFPLLSYMPVPAASALSPTPAGALAYDAEIQDEEVTYKRQYLMGAAFGALLGGAIGFVAGGDVNNSSRGEQALVGAAIGAGFGLVFGYFIKTPVVNETALRHVIPDTVALAAADGGSGLQLGWHSAW